MVERRVGGDAVGSAAGDTVTGERRHGADRRRDGKIRIAAVGDVHCGEADTGLYRDLLAAANDEADVLVLCGDLTRRGLAVEFKIVVGELTDVKIPIIAVLGNHDYEAGEIGEGSALLRGRGVHLLAGDAFQLNDKIGFAGVKGFMGGFGRGTLTAFGEPETKAFVGCAIEESQKLEMALRRLSTPLKIVVLHYAPVAGTVQGEPEFIFPYLGTDRLAEAIDRYGASVVFHGHVHSGTFKAQTPAGIPVFNVSLPLLQNNKIARLYYLHEVALPVASGGG
ncbi:MAG TPA: metallophosphoesterase [Gemmatimonadaceae bacterium]|nr:metallophosphoesterase [Gemmatimonadaceae bacterium]